MSTNARFYYQNSEIDIDDETTTTIGEITENNKSEIIIKDLFLEKTLDDISLYLKTNDKSSFLSDSFKKNSNNQNKINIIFPDKRTKQCNYFPQQTLDEFRKKIIFQKNIFLIMKML